MISQRIGQDNQPLEKSKRRWGGFIPKDHEIENVEKLSEEIVSTYQANISLVQSLAKKYSFDVVFYWQPSIFNKNNLTEYESTQKESVIEIEQLFESVNENIGNKNIEKITKSKFHDISTSFASLSEPLFVDWCHLGEQGNRYIANKIFTDVYQIISDNVSAKGTDKDKVLN